MKFVRCYSTMCSLFKRFVAILLLPIYQYLYVLFLRRKEKINVVFFAMCLSMWKYQHLYELLIKSTKFNPIIIILPCYTYSKDQQERDIKDLIAYFDSKGVVYTMGQNEDGSYKDIRKLFSPDLLFYPQPYKGYFHKSLMYDQFYDKLLCYSPYAFWITQDEWCYNEPLHKAAWKLFYSTKFHKRDAEMYSLRKSSNVEIVGYPMADDFLSGQYVNLWKHQLVSKKKVIWAPHFTISSGGFVSQSNFLWMSEVMLQIAKLYSDRIQFAFKPHPRLFTELCRHRDWGIDKAKEYYAKWSAMENSQIEIGEYVDLFMTSDAMIHDSGSFCVEYHFSGNPVLYIASNFKEQVEKKNEFGQLAMKLHYVGCTVEHIIDFIEKVVLDGKDPKRSDRLHFRDKYLLPPNGKTVAQNTMDILLKAFC